MKPNKKYFIELRNKLIELAADAKEDNDSVLESYFMGAALGILIVVVHNSEEAKNVCSSIEEMHSFMKFTKEVLNK